MADEDNKRAAHQALVQRVLNAPAMTTPEQRARAFDNDGVPAQLQPLLDKVVTQPAQVSDTDFADAKASGYTEDELFELVVCAVVGQSARLYDAGLAALARAADDGDAG